MSTVLAYTSPAIGHLFPMVPLLQELKARGHAVHVRTLRGQVPVLLAEGLQAGPLDDGILAVEATDYQAGNAKAALVSSVETFTARARFDAPDLQKAIDDVDPDLLLIDINAWGARIQAESAGLPWATFSPYTPPLQSKGTPPFGPGLAPMAGPLGKARDALARRLVIGAVEKLMLPRINALRAELSGGKLPPVDGADHMFRTSPLMLVATSEPFEYPHPDWGPGVRMIGALEWEPPVQPPAWLREVEKPLVLVTTSSEYQADEGIVRAALAGLAADPFMVVATLPAAESGSAGASHASGSAGFAPVPPNEARAFRPPRPHPGACRSCHHPRRHGGHAEGAVQGSARGGGSVRPGPA